MKLHFLGTGHWRSKDREPTCLYLQIDSYNMMFECPVSAAQLLKNNGLRKPDAVFVSSSHPQSYNKAALEEIYTPGADVNIMHGARIGPLSIRTQSLGYADGKIVGFNVFRENTKLLTFAPKYSNLSSSFIEDTKCLVIGSSVGDSMRPMSPSVTQRKSAVAHNAYLVNLLGEKRDRGQETLLKDCKEVRIPEDGEVINIMSNSGIYLHRPGLATLVADGKFPSVVKSSSFRDYVDRPIFLCSEEGVHAKVVLSEGKEISRSDFRDAVVHHGMLVSEAAELWPGYKELYMFDVEIQEKYDKPLEYNKPLSYRAFLEDVDADIPEQEEEQEGNEERLQEVIRKEDNVIILYDEDEEKVLGRFPFGEGEEYKNEESAREAAMEREKQVKMFNHMDEEEEEEEEQEELEEAQWSTEYKNDLPDSAFLYIEPGGEKDDEGKTKPRSLRHLPIRDSNGGVDLPHLRNAISRLGQSATGKNWEGFDGDKREALQNKAQKILERVTESQTIVFLTKDGTMRTLRASVRETTIEDTDEPGLFIEEV